MPRPAALLALSIALLGLPATAGAAPAEWPTPVGTDPRCGQFGAGPGRGALVPVSLVVQDLSMHGELGPFAETLRATLASDLELSGAVRINPRDRLPPGGFVTWISDEAFDWIGWHVAGAWLVLVAEVSPAEDGVRVSLDAYLTEEGDRLHVRDAVQTVAPDRAPRLAHRYANALVGCLTGVPGAFGTRITYARRVKPGAPKEIFVAEFGGLEQVQVSRDGKGTMLPAWAPGGVVAWTGYAADNPDVYLDGRPFSTRPGQNSGVAFGPDGRYAALTIATEANPDIWLVDARTGAEVARLTEGRAIDTSPAWSPDGRRIAFVSDREGGPQVWVMEADGRDPHPLPLPGSYNTSPDWSPDGREIAYQSRGGGDRFTINVHDLETGETRTLGGGRWSDEEPTWSPDGRWILFTSTRRGAKLLFVMDREGQGARPVFPNGGDYFTPAWERVFR